MNSWRVSKWVRNTPSIAEVVTYEFCFSTPRIRMHRCFVHQGVRNLGREPFLDLQAPRVNLDHPRDLRKADDSAVRQVRNVSLTVEGQQVMLAQRIEVEIPAQDHLLVVFLGKECTVDSLLGILRVTVGEKLERLHHARGGTRKPLALGILAEMTQKRPHGLFGGCPVCPFLGHDWLLLSAGSSDPHGFGGG